MVQIDMLMRTRRRSIALQVSPQGNLIVRAPTHFSYEKIQKIVQQKEEWILLHQKRIVENRKVNLDILNYEKVLFCGATYSVVFADKIKEIKFFDNCCWLPESWKESKIKQVKNIMKVLKLQAQKILMERLTYFANLMQLKPSSAVLSNSRRVWGSCDRTGNIKLNWRVVMLPPDLIDYVVVHELSHILQFNHSILFWKIVGSVLPNYKERRQILKKGDYLLEIFR